VPASAQPTLIDLARTHRPRLRRTRWIIKDLSQLDTSARQLDATRADRLRFLTTYLRSRPGARPVRWYARRIVRKSDRILRRIARKAARLQSEPLARARGPNETGSNADDAPPRPPL
ncbi:MAG: lipopolysaccharide kinase InaA family protein, partial [Planctomycetota bacterium]